MKTVEQTSSAGLEAPSIRSLRVRSSVTGPKLIDEGRRLRRPAKLLSPDHQGEVVAVWRGKAEPASERAEPWCEVDVSHVPGADLAGWITVSLDYGSSEPGPLRRSLEGVDLFARDVSVSPPIDAIFLMGTRDVKHWLSRHNWDPAWGYNGNFPDYKAIEEYEDARRQTDPLFQPDAFAILGGWHNPWPDDDWHDLLPAKLLLTTIKDAEPWVELWQLPDGSLKPIARIT